MSPKRRMRYVQVMLASLGVVALFLWLDSQHSLKESALIAPAVPTGLVVVRDARPLMGTVWEITIATRNRSRQEVSAVVDEAFAEIVRVDQALSDWRQGTELNEVNRYAGVRPVSVSNDTYDVVETAYHYSKISDGAFDITFNVLWGVWDFKKKSPSLPDPAEIDRRISLINYRNVVLNPEVRTVFLRQKGMKIGLGGIGKGYAVDCVCTLLARHGLKNYIVAGGGDMRVSGSRGKSSWRLGVQHPRREGLLYLLDMSDVAVATSGDYERYFILDGKRYHHILDPKTGYPARGVSSVTIMAPNATDADALATSVFVLGVQKGMDLLEGIPGVQGIIVDVDLRPTMTDGLRVRPEESSGIPMIRLARTQAEAMAR